ncbi:Mobile element protein [Sphingobium indicum BiD32]|uniref:Mobile element protein n=1 Tax=Sphingobium indicum BiD32 TaxID=1301087 RepID=N1MJG8_9SPHN|nr:Mobile element protein [Sphingobium indicum BiD32]
MTDRIEASVLGSDILHADDTPVRVLAPERRAKGIGKGVMQGRIWGYVRDQRPWAGTAPPGVAYRYAPNWKAEHVLAHLGDASGILQADAYKGYAKLYELAANGEPRFREAACFAHWRRDFHDISTSQKSEIAHEALERIGQLYDIEREIAGKPADIRRAVRQELSKPKLEALRTWAAGTRSACSSMMGASPSITTPPSAPSGPYAWARRTGYLSGCDISWDMVSNAIADHAWRFAALVDEVS